MFSICLAFSISKSPKCVKWDQRMAALYMDVHQKISEEGTYITSMAVIRYNQAIQLIYNAIGLAVLSDNKHKYKQFNNLIKRVICL